MEFISELAKVIMQYVTLEGLYTLFAIFVAIDVFTGVIKAWKQRRLKSRTLRDGLFASMAEMLILVLGIVITKIVPVTTIAVIVVMVWMCIKELYSILENITEIGGRIPKFLIKGLAVYINKIDNIEIKNVEKIDEEESL